MFTGSRKECVTHAAKNGGEAVKIDGQWSVVGGKDEKAAKPKAKPKAAPKPKKAT